MNTVHFSANGNSHTAVNYNLSSLTSAAQGKGRENFHIICRVKLNREKAALKS